MRHKHCEVIKAWADGKKVQVRRNADRPWEDVSDPNWFNDKEYRVKPETVKYRVSLHKSSLGRMYTLSADNERDELEYSRCACFVKWLTEWQEV